MKYTEINIVLNGMTSENVRRESGDVEDDDTNVGDYGSDYDENGRRKSSQGFDQYQFENPFLEDDEDSTKMAAANIAQDAERFLQLARLKTTEYSKLDFVKLATSAEGLGLSKNLVEPVRIPSSEDERLVAVQEIYGPDMSTETEPVKDPVRVLQTTEVELPEKITDSANIYDALNSQFLKSNYKAAIYRLFLLGTHDENMSDFIRWNKHAIEAINVQSAPVEFLGGVLCIYEYYYLHVLEGSADNITKLMQKYADDLEPSEFEWSLSFRPDINRFVTGMDRKFHTVQSWVLGIFRIDTRQLGPWRGEKVFPNRMQESDVPPGAFREKYFHFLRQCMVLAFTYNSLNPARFNLALESSADLTPKLRNSMDKAKIQRFRSLGKVVPPVSFIQYVLGHASNPKLKIRPIREHLELFGGTPPYVSQSNLQWPPPCKIVPYD